MPFSEIVVPPYPGPGPGEMAGELGPSGMVRAANVLTILGVVAGFVIALLILVAFAGTFLMESQGQGIGTASFTGTQFRLILVGLVLYNLLLSIVLLVLAGHARRGRNGARIALTVIGGFHVGFGLLVTFTGQPWAVIGVIYVAAAVVFYWVGTRRFYSR